jgi:hypothetical protein
MAARPYVAASLGGLSAAPSSYCARNSAEGGIGVITSISTPFGSAKMKCRWPKG